MVSKLYIYSAPQIRDVSVIRCDSSGNADDSGTYLKISATRNYCNPYWTAPGTAVTNSCEIRYRYRQLPSGTYSAWVTILASSNLTTNSVVTGALVGTLTADENYEVIVGVLDKVSEASTSIILPAGGVFMHRDGEKNSISIGEKAVDSNTVTIAEKLTTFIKGLLKTKDIQCDGTLKMGLSSLKWNRFYIAGPNYQGDVTIDLSGAATTNGVVASISQNPAGSISASCKPNADGTSPGAVFLEMANTRAGTGLQLGLFNDRSMIYGLTAPESPKDAVNKQYVDTNFAPAVESADYPGCYYRTVGVETEWLNPPMVTGTEYRTTERFDGKPVYVKCINLQGKLPEAGSGKHISHGITMSYPIGCYGVYADQQAYPLNFNFSSYCVTKTTIYVYPNSSSGVTANSKLKVVIKYVK